MNSRERFLETMQYGHPDRVPYFEEGIRPEVLKAWQQQGLPAGTDLGRRFHTDERNEIDLDLYPHPWPRRWPTRTADLKTFKRRLNPMDDTRLPEGWRQDPTARKGNQQVVMIRLHQGFFLTMGVYGWQRFHELMKLIHDDPAFVSECMRLQAEFVTDLARRVLQEQPVDAAIFSEPIGDNHGPLISPRMFEDFVLKSFVPILELLREQGVKTFILRTYANARLLIPVLVAYGFNCLWACEVNTEAMDYRSLRREFGRDLRLIGGIDLDILREDRHAIQREIETKVPPLLEQGGYIPLADGRVRADIPLENYLYYRELLEKLTRP